VLSLLELGAGFGPDFSGRENIYLNGALHGFDRAQIDARIEEIVAFSELGEFIDVPVKAYSSGMYLRLGFSIVAHLDADILLIDEILTVGDASFQQKCLRRIAQQMEGGATIVLVSHDPAAIERVCDRLVVLDRGRIAFDGAVPEGLLFYHRLLGSGGGGSEVLRRRDRRAAVEVAELELKDPSGRERHIFRTGESLAVDMTLNAPVPVERASLALEVRDQRGELCFRTDSVVGAVGGRTRVRFEIPRLSLLGGDYDVAVGAYGQDAPSTGLLDRVVRFSVAPTLDGEGVADLRGTWTVAGERVVEEALS
jgi:energy-coupling factor transporter ATP-binding protein EcfA2